jgi:hypothetical protein
MTERTRFVVPEKPKHPLGWNCSNCFHVVKSPDGKQMKCCAHPPYGTMVNMQGGMAAVSINPPVQDGEWCGEFLTPEEAGVKPKVDA